MPPGGMPPGGMQGAPPGPPPQGMPNMPVQPPPPQQGFNGDTPMRAPSKGNGAPAAPNATLYVNNLNEKIKIDELKKALFHVFSQFGSIVEICASKDLHRKGQAWVIFDNVESATKALGEMTNFSFYGKPMQVSFAKVKSDVVSKKDGSFLHRPKRKIEKKDKKGKKKGKKGKKEKKSKKEKAAKAEAALKADPGAAAPMDTAQSSTASAPSAAPPVKEETAAPASSPQALAPAAPNRILFVENLPAQCDDTLLSMLFQQYAGFKEARLVNGKPGIAFVEYNDVSQSVVAKQALHNFRITPTNIMKVTYARQ